MELGSYAKNKGETLKKIMGHHCYVEQEKARKASDLAEEVQKEFPTVQFEVEPVEFVPLGGSGGSARSGDLEDAGDGSDYGEMK